MEIMQEIAADAFKKIGAAHHRVDTSKHPAMHKTDTIDYIILLKGDVTLILDEEEVRLEPMMSWFKGVLIMLGLIMAMNLHY